MNLMIHIVESNENVLEITMVEAANVIQNPRSIYIAFYLNFCRFI